MAPTVTIRFNEEEFEVVRALANKHNKSVGALIKDLAIESTGYEEELEVTVQNIDAAANGLSSGEEFKIRDLFDVAHWESYSIGSRLSVGRKFIQKVKNDPDFKARYEFVEKDSDNAAIYRRK